jgi:hypothetical protein
MLQDHLQILFLTILLAEYLHLLKEDFAELSQSFKTFYRFYPLKVGQISVYPSIDILHCELSHFILW